LRHGRLDKKCFGFKHWIVTSTVKVKRKSICNHDFAKEPGLNRKTFVGFGFGAIQAGLFLLEAKKTECFKRLVVAEIIPETVAALRANQGFFSVNIAHADRIETVTVGPVEVLNPNQPEERTVLLEALAEAQEIATAVPSVENYVGEGEGSLHLLLADGFQRKIETAGPRAVVYAAENHNHAAEILEAHVVDARPRRQPCRLSEKVQFLNTVIGKMSGLVGVAEDANETKLAKTTPGGRRAFLVEAFNRILISKIRFAEPFARGISVFEEKDDLLPFEEAKLFGHNAVHASAAYLGRLYGATKIGELREIPGFMQFLRDAFLLESGETLMRKHAGVDRLFTPPGWREYAEDLLERMTNPHLRDTVERVGRDLPRKLGWNDRLIGVMRNALAQNVPPNRFAVAAAAAVDALDERFLKGNAQAQDILVPLWSADKPDEAEQAKILELIEQGKQFFTKGNLCFTAAEIRHNFTSSGRGDIRG
jgi:mannitol-1-phosphate 5-dehydrogenase